MENSPQNIKILMKEVMERLLYDEKALSVSYMVKFFVLK